MSSLRAWITLGTIGLIIAIYSTGAVCEELTPDQVIANSIAYHDPNDVWGLGEVQLEHGVLLGLVPWRTPTRPSVADQLRYAIGR